MFTLQAEILPDVFVFRGTVPEELIITQRMHAAIVLVALCPCILLPWHIHSTTLTYFSKWVAAMPRKIMARDDVAPMFGPDCPADGLGGGGKFPVAERLTALIAQVIYVERISNILPQGCSTVFWHCLWAWLPFAWRQLQTSQMASTALLAGYRLPSSRQVVDKFGLLNRAGSLSEIAWQQHSLQGHLVPYSASFSSLLRHGL